MVLIASLSGKGASFDKHEQVQTRKRVAGATPEAAPYASLSAASGKTSSMPSPITPISV
jgi:hypothetical protein